MSKTLNYWLGKLNRLQMFGHGVKDLVVSCERLEELYEIVNVREIDGTVYIEIK